MIDKPGILKGFE